MGEAREHASFPDGVTRYEQVLELDAGRRDGLLPGMLDYSFGPNEGRLLEIQSVEADQCVAAYRFVDSERGGEDLDRRFTWKFVTVHPNTEVFRRIVAEHRSGGEREPVSR